MDKCDFGSWFEQWQAALVYGIYSSTAGCTWELAEEVIQDAAVKVWERWDAHPPNDQQHAFNLLRQIATRAAWGRIRQESRYHNWDAEIEGQQGAPPSPGPREMEPFYSVCRETLGRLSAADQEVLGVKYSLDEAGDCFIRLLSGQGITNQELGEYLALTAAQAWRRYRRAEATFYGLLISSRPDMLAEVEESHRRVLEAFYRIQWSEDRSAVRCRKPQGVAPRTLADILGMPEPDSSAARTQAERQMLAARRRFLQALIADLN